MTNQDRQIAEMYEDKKDLILWKALEIMERPPKKRLKSNGDLVDVYSVPVFSGWSKIIGVEYVEHPVLLLPQELFERLIYWEDLCNPQDNKKLTLPYTEKLIKKYVKAIENDAIRKTKAAEKESIRKLKAEKDAIRKSKAVKKGTKKRCRKVFTDADVEVWVKLKKEGKNIKAIAEITGVKESTILNYVYKALRKEKEGKQDE